MRGVIWEGEVGVLGYILGEGYCEVWGDVGVGGGVVDCEDDGCCRT